jgi:NAD(P)-dependent dehydrogenase (short-subunit alcohol dehydrogenase family)
MVDKKVAIVTGGGQGIGKAISRRLLETGFNVVIAEIDEEAGRETASELSDIGNILFIETDVSNEMTVSYMVNETSLRFGKIDVLVNNAGIFQSCVLSDLTLDAWNRIISVNLTGTLLSSKYAAPILSVHHGSIINISSTRALMSEPNTEAYSASKGGILSLTHALALSLAPDVRVNCISPGWIDVSEWKKMRERTIPDVAEKDKAQHPSGRVGTPEDIASMVEFLTKDENTFITGQNFVIDGGMTKKMVYV